ncbi:hypothetical protein L596_009094 [Steinernema carpocapsae]|uniref:receptor protein-tyrosine kinase n=1 Tax=Steinernema carpocapsae TaxID=34508 RepID=A0A4U5PEM8_STECR|nr:hypothetical protein L596_009094 [Steinernema carpocapsae]
MTMEFRVTADHKVSKDYSKCTVIEGDFGISIIETPKNDTLNNAPNQEYLKFPNVREITGYLWIFGAKGLQSLSGILPNLRVIGGQNLMMHYALVLYMNDIGLTDIGLTKLTAIRNGGVRIIQNDQLCYTRNIDWSKLTYGTITEVKSDLSDIALRSKKCENLDPICGPKDKLKRESQCTYLNGKLACWNAESCQKECQHGIYFVNNGTEKRYGPGCDPQGNRCHEKCFGGCDRINDPTKCYSCQRIRHKGTCVDKCPPHMFEYMKRRCVTQEQCQALNPLGGNYFKAIKGKCETECPEGYIPDEKDRNQCKKCVGVCLRVCNKPSKVDTIEAAMSLSSCQLIRGSLTIQLFNIDVALEEKLREAFSKIVEIEDYLLIQFTKVMRSLDLLPNLKKIHGKNLIDMGHKYALVVLENENLVEIPEDMKIEIVRGKVNFNNNQKLCPHVIKRFLKASNVSEYDETMQTGYDKTDVSPFSNGNANICAEKFFDVTVTDVFDYGFILQWEPFDTTGTDPRMLFGYAIYYKSVSGPTEDPDRTASRSSDCSDTWQSTFFSQDLHHHITHGYISATPDTYYAFYVEPRVSRNSNITKTVSHIGYVKTKYAVPSRPRNVVSAIRGQNQIEIRWDPPKEQRGVITHYQVSWMEEVRAETVVGHVCALSNHYREAAPAITVTKADKAPPKQCSAKKGCCECRKKVDLYKEAVKFNGTETRIPSRKRRSLHSSSNESTMTDEKNLTEYTTTTLSPETKYHMVTSSDGTVNVSLYQRPVILTNMPHFSHFVIGVRACQNDSVDGARCSLYRVTRIRTQPLPDRDLIDPSTIRAEMRNASDLQARVISWKDPEAPNGAILAYWIRLELPGERVVVETCCSKADYDKNRGVPVKLMVDGFYNVKVGTVSMSQKSRFSTAHKVFEIRTSWFTWRVISLLIVVTFVLMALCGVGLFFALRKYYSDRIMREYWKKAVEAVEANPDYSSQYQRYSPDEWEIPRNRLRVHEEIGRGSFGKVLRGTADDYETVNGQIFGQCAIKTVTDNASSEEQVHFLIEGSVMKRFNADFIVKLYGIVSDGIPVYVVMEFMANGNLRDYLRAHRPNAEENVDNRPLPTQNQFFLWASQVADGMAYLQSKLFVHRDLAARNCLVSVTGCVKIGDFGMARDMCYQEYYRPSGKRMMPVRWMSPEALKDGKFSIYSDVWSFGILLYEIVTLGMLPYAGLDSGELFDYIVVNRMTIKKPDNCSDVWFGLMKKCWKYDARRRPTFFHIVHYLIPHLKSEEFEAVSIAKNDPEELFVDLYDKPYNFCPDEEDLMEQVKPATRLWSMNPEMFEKEEESGSYFSYSEDENYAPRGGFGDQEETVPVDDVCELHESDHESDENSYPPRNERLSFHHPRRQVNFQFGDFSDSPQIENDEKEDQGDSENEQLIATEGL